MKFRKFGPFVKLKENSDLNDLKSIGISFFEHAACTSALIRLILEKKYTAIIVTRSELCRHTSSL